MNSNTLTCVNCQSVTTNDGRTVWVCESCGADNATVAPDVAAAQAAITDAVGPVDAPSIEVPHPTAPAPQVVSSANPPLQPLAADLGSISSVPQAPVANYAPTSVVTSANSFAKGNTVMPEASAPVVPGIPLSTANQS